MNKQVTVTKAEVNRVVKAINMVNVQKHWPITEAQSELLDRLTQCYTKGRAFTMKDARECYLKSTRADYTKTKLRDPHTLKDRIMKPGEPAFDHYISPKALTWMKLNLGAIVMKQRAIILPIMDLNEQ